MFLVVQENGIQLNLNITLEASWYKVSFHILQRIFKTFPLLDMSLIESIINNDRLFSCSLDTMNRVIDWEKAAYMYLTEFLIRIQKHFYNPVN